MGFRFQRRLNYGSGLGMNLSKSGASPSLRSRAGAISAKGFSIRTGIPGLSLRRSWGKGSDGAIFGMLALVAVLAINTFAFVLSLAMKVLFALLGIAISGVWFLVAVAVNICAWVSLTTYDFFRYKMAKRAEVGSSGSDDECA